MGTLLGKRALIFLAAAGLAFSTADAASAPAQFARLDVLPARTVSAEDLLDVNIASLAQLAALPGMGKAYAKRIVDARPYTAKNQLVTRGILPRDAYDRIKDLVVAHRPPKL